MYAANLKHNIEHQSSVVGVIGLGYVGLPLAVEMCKQGFRVIGMDLNPSKIASIRQGNSYIKDVSDKTLQQCMDTGRFMVTNEYEHIREMDAVSICVPTPLSENQDPDTSYITQVVDQLKQYMKKGSLITLESTTYPGTTEELIQREIEKRGYRAGEDFFLCFSPERVDPSNTKYNTFNTPKVIGGATPTCLELGSALYSRVVMKVVPVSSTKVAEMSKLLENTFRSVNIAFINEMAMMCDRMSIDIWEVIEAASTKPFGFMPFYPGPGIGGHCIPLDPMYLSWKAKGFRFYSKFIDIAQSINANMPYYVVEKTGWILNQSAKSLNQSRILILGMAYKPDIDDLRESPGLEVYELFGASGANVAYYDPHATHFVSKSGKKVCTIDYSLTDFPTYDCMVLITNHQSLDYEQLADLSIPILDTRNAFQAIERPNIFKLGNSVQQIQGEWDRVVQV
ncbi:nucleotide sugar dehydrogenase [Paenibacillus popilliae]|uniref:UDP-N-acetyl-D-mannosaminuronate dehydrogenase n=1 Tax=Paenibacillus popilliae ATCC 14706 TaxID=1212764 RepID=M9LHD7_PAEPP|nr:nucleotide sugar dehydrogenase [Paenibacillus popilliae]GAC42175.1 UDP-N-acetyl-D-mannosaminuronate dehydrogenase [Paenibacillus popilliae ATCC 14706]